MAQNYDLDRYDPLPAFIMDALQEFIGTLCEGLRLTLVTPSPSSDPVTQVSAAAGSGSSQVGIGIGGLWRYRTSNVTATVPAGSAGLVKIFVTAPTANDYTPPDTDATDYAWGLVLTKTTPGGVTAYRQVGELDWDGTTITALRQTVGLGDSRAPITPTAETAGTPAVRAIAAASQTAAVLAMTNASGTVKWSVSPDGRTSIPVGSHSSRPSAGNGGFYYESDTGKLYLDTGSAWVLCGLGDKSPVVDGGQGNYADRPSAGVASRLYWATDKKRLYRDNGTSWDDPLRGSASGTSLPSSPVDGQEYEYTGIGRCIYSSSRDKWIVRDPVVTTHGITNGARAATASLTTYSWVADFGTNLPQGTYLFRWLVNLSETSGGLVEARFALWGAVGLASSTMRGGYIATSIEAYRYIENHGEVIANFGGGTANTMVLKYAASAGFNIVNSSANATPLTLDPV